MKVGIDFLAGIEISAEYPRPGTMHLLGYGIDPANATLTNLTRDLIAGREGRNERIIAKLQALGMKITLDEVLAKATGTVGRPHFAAVLVEKGYVATNAEAFKHFLGQGGSAYEDKETISPKRAIEMINAAGGVAVLAHPIQLKKENDAQLESEIKNLTDFGLGGLECIHSDHRDSYTEQLIELSKKYALVKTGGSDFHGGSKPHIRLGRAGRRRVPSEWFEHLKKKVSRGR